MNNSIRIENIPEDPLTQNYVRDFSCAGASQQVIMTTSNASNTPSLSDKDRRFNRFKCHRFKQWVMAIGKRVKYLHNNCKICSVHFKHVLKFQEQPFNF
jgi:hypothetical protein